MTTDFKSDDLATAPVVHWMSAKRMPLILALTVLAISLFVTFSLWTGASQQAQTLVRADFNFQVRQTVRRIEQRMAAYEQVQRGTRAFLLGSMNVTSADFKLYVDSLHLQEKFPGVQGIAVVEIVQPAAKAEHTAKVRAAGKPLYEIKPGGERDIYSSIVQIEPLTGLNPRALGYDMLTDPVRREAMERARDTGEAAASGKVRLIQENGQRDQNGFVMYLPVFKRGAQIDTIDQRRAAIIGWIGAPFRMDDLMSRLGGERAADMILSIYDGENLADTSRLYHSLPDQATASTHTSMFTALTRITVAGKPWTLHIKSGPSYETRIETDRLLIIAWGGSGISVVLGLLVWSLASSRRRALALANLMTQQLRASEFRWKYALEGAGDGVWDWNNKTGEVQYSDRWKAMLGYEPGDIGDTFSEWERLLHPDDKAQAMATANNYLDAKRKTNVNEHRMRCKDGSWKWILSRGMAVVHDTDGNALRTIGTHTDITPIKEQEQALRLSYAQLAAEQQRIKIILENSHDAFVAFDANSCITDWNTKAEKTFGWSAAEAIGRDFGELLLAHEHAHAPNSPTLHLPAVSDDGAISNVIELNAVHRNGTLIPVELAVAGFREGSDYITSAFIRDISERKQGEQRDTERSRVLDEVRVALQHSQKLEAVGKLTGGVAHDFNNLLQIIGGNIQLLQHFYAAEPAALKRLTSMLSAVERGAKLSSQLLAFARRQPLQPIALNAARLIHNMDDLLTRALGESIAVESVVDRDLWNTFVDPGQLENVILNLAINARDAMTGSGKLRIELSNITLDREFVHAHAEVPAGDYVRLAIADNGTGMTPDVAEQAFEPFFTTKPTGEGTGLGLSMAYGFVKQSRGHIQIDTEPGRGTTINIYLPRSDKAEVVVAPRTPGIVVGGSETILVAEDDKEVQATVVAVLEELGYTVLKADDGESALHIVSSGLPIDLLFTDVVMPGPVSSLDLAREAKRLLPGLAILFTSGYTQNAMVSDGKLDEGIELLGKPYLREQLAHRIRQVLAQQQGATAHTVNAASTPRLSAGA
ncbi:MAG: CHASE domain-containing protein [Herminiimonas sp.]|nr:CHASE domain-containing protein [Herminiimonas sp.]